MWSTDGQDYSVKRPINFQLSIIYAIVGSVALYVHYLNSMHFMREKSFRYLIGTFLYQINLNRTDAYNNELARSLKIPPNDQP